MSFAQSLPPAARMLLALSRPDRAVGPASVPPAQLYAEAAQQGVVGLLARDPLDPRFAELAKPWLLVNSAQTLAITREAGAIARVLAAEGIECIFLKGPFLSARYYGALGTRDAGDLDLLVPEDKVWAVDSLLQAAGYSRYKPGRALAGARARLYLDTQHEVGYWSPDRQLSVEVHWRFADCRALQHASFARLLARSEVLQIGPLPLRVLSPLDTFIHLAIHGSLIAWPRLKWIADLEFVQATLDADDRAALDRLAHEPAFGRMITLAHSLLAPPPMAEPWLTAALRHVARQYETPNDPAPRRGWAHHRYLRSLVRGARNRLMFLRANAIMPADFDQSEMPDYASRLLPYVAFGRRVLRKAFGTA